MAGTLASGCRAYLCIMNTLMMLGGSLLLLFAMWMLANRYNVEDLNALDDMTWKLNIGLLVVGAMLVWTGILGFMFSSGPENACAGLSYLTVILAGVIVQFIILWAVLMKLHLVQELETKSAEDTVTKFQRDILVKSFDSFGKRISEDGQFDQHCEFVVPGRDDPYDLFREAEHTTAMSSMWYRRLEEQDVDGGRCQDTSVLACEDEDWAKQFSCLAKPGHEERFGHLCKRCHASYAQKYLEKSENWNLVKGYWEDETIRLAFCRCYGRVLDSVHRHSDQILVAVITYLGLQLILLLSAVAQLLCPPVSEREDVWLEMARRY
mmetsp:Transcript_58720/g.137018  ORF Transcript_58720/g.137018 Transcript_58720/m.137018 type:complete len:322 (+) Transcript_58720:59-1024(+)